MDGEPEIDVIKLKADYDTAVADLSKANATIEDKDKEIAKLQAYIARYVSSNTSSAPSPDAPKPASFEDSYRSCIEAMAKPLKDME